MWLDNGSHSLRGCADKTRSYTSIIRRTWPRLIKQAIEPALDEALAPLAYRLWRHPRAARNLATGQTLRRRKHDARTRRQRLRCAAAPRPFGELIVLLHRQRYLFKLRSATHSSLPDVHYEIGHRSSTNVQRINNSRR